MPANLENSQWPQDWKRSVFIPIPKKAYARQCSNYYRIALISHTSKVMVKILQARLQQYVNRELSDVQAGFRKGRGTRDQIASICQIIKRARQFQKNFNFCLIDYAKAFDCVDLSKLWKILKEMGIPDYLTCLLRNLYAGKEALHSLIMSRGFVLQCSELTQSIKLVTSVLHEIWCNFNHTFLFALSS